MDQQRDICLFLTRSKNLKKILLNPKNSRCHAEKIRARKTRFAISEESFSFDRSSREKHFAFLKLDFDLMMLVIVNVKERIEDICC